MITPPKPSLRGWTHVGAALVTLIAGIWLAASAQSKAGLRASAVFTASLLTQFCISGLYHTKTWQPKARTWLRRADHAAIFLLIAGTYTPICLLALNGPLGRKLLIQVWTAAGLGFLQSLFFVGLSRKITAVLYVAMGWIASRHYKEIVHETSRAWSALILLGGILYSIGAAAYAMKWPDPYPKTFGYHEIFHIFVILAAAVHFVAVAQLVLQDDAHKWQHPFQS